MGEQINTFKNQFIWNTLCILTLQLKNNNQMEENSWPFRVLILFLLILFSKCDQYSQNLIINGNFGYPNITTLSLWKLFNKSIYGWNCTNKCELQDCEAFGRLVISQNLPFPICQGQIMDLNSYQMNEEVSQIFYATPSLHTLRFNYIFPTRHSNLKTFKVYLNGVLIFRFSPSVAGSTQIYLFESVVLLMEGQNQIMFKNEGYYQDGTGFSISNVSIVRNELKQIETFMNNTINNPVLNALISLPALRTIFGQMFTFFVSFDRLQLYQYDNRTNSRTITIFLQNICNLLNLKSMVASQLSLAATSYFAVVQDFINNSNNFKGPYASNLLLSNPNIIIYSLPYIILMCLILQGIFYCMFHWRYSVVLRKYCFGATLVWMYFDGNLEQLTFYFFGETTNLFSFRLFDKLYNFFVVLFGFAVLFTFCLFLWWRYSYGRKSKYFLETNPLLFSGFCAMGFDRGVICFLFGTTHYFLQNYIIVQLGALASLEFLWLASMMFHLQRQSYKNLLMVWLSIVECLLRLVFQMSLFLYNTSSDTTINVKLNNQVDVFIVLAFMGLWALEFLVGIWTILSEVIHLIKMRPRTAKVKTKPKTKDKPQIIQRKILRITRKI